MGRTRARLAGGALALAASCVLAGCGAGAAHVIGPGASTPSTTSTSQPAGSTTSPVPTTGVTSTAPPSGSSLAPGITNQIDSDLNALDNSLTQADNDLANPNKGDQ